MDHICSELTGTLCTRTVGDHREILGSEYDSTLGPLSPRSELNEIDFEGYGI